MGHLLTEVNELANQIDTTMNSLESKSIIREELPPVSLIDSVVFGDQDWMMSDHEGQQALRLQLLREAFAHHVDSCAAYASFAQRLGFGPEDLVDPADLSRIPQFPTAIYKRRQLLSVPSENVVTSFISSGTSGVRSVIYRDATTLHRLCGMMRSDSPLFGTILEGVDDSNTTVINLGTSRQESGQVWFGYVMSLLEQIAPMRSYLSNAEIDFGSVAEDLLRQLVEMDHVFLIGPPFLIADFCAFVREKGIRIDGGSQLLVFTGGGWKMREQERVSRDEFDGLVTSSLGLSEVPVIRDVFNQVELNTLLIECEHRSKHVPPWVHVFTRDPATFVPLPDGETGVLSFSDASAHSYPCFYVGDDLGQVMSTPCRCGRPGLTMRIQNRLRGASHTGCADTMQSAVAANSGEDRHCEIQINEGRTA